MQSLTDPIAPAFAREFQVSSVHGEIPSKFLDKVVDESLKVPAHVWGEHDPFFPRSDQEALVASIPHATLRIYAQVSHNPHWEQPDQFVADLEQFLRTNDTPPRYRA